MLKFLQHEHVLVSLSSVGWDKLSVLSSREKVSFVFYSEGDKICAIPHLACLFLMFIIHIHMNILCTGNASGLALSFLLVFPLCLFLRTKEGYLMLKTLSNSFLNYTVDPINYIIKNP